uniref:Uncharacterized protein n=1 Tax=Oryza glumipatula TaxID=40148 RepID=A0A0E0AVK5_9ORYZ
MPSGERRNQSVLWGGERDWMRPRPTRREQTQQHSSTSTSTSTSTKRARWQGEDDEEDDQINGLPDRLELRRARVPSARLMPQLLQLNMSSPAQSGNKQKTYTSFGQSKKDISKRMAIELEAYAVKGMRKATYLSIVSRPW